MRVLLLTHRLPYAPNRGDRTRAFHLIGALRRFADVDLVSLLHDDHEEHRVGDVEGRGVRVWGARVSRWRSLRRLPHALARSTPLTHVLLDSPAIQTALEEASRRCPDVVVAYCSGMAPFAMRPPLDAIPFVLDMVDADSAKWDALARRAPFPRRLIYRREAECLRAFEVAACRRAAAVLVVNDRERGEIARHSPAARLEVIENGLDLHRLSPTASPVEHPTAVFCGVMSYEPNVEAVCWLVDHVWPQVRRRRPDARLLIVGSTPTLRVRRLASEAAGIEVTGTVPDVCHYLRRAAISVAPLRTGRGVQNKVLEAVGFGLPCVITSLVREGLPPELLPACRVADAASSFAETIIELFGRTGAERRRIATSANLEPLAWDRRFAPIRGVLERACGLAAAVAC